MLVTIVKRSSVEIPGLDFNIIGPPSIREVATFS